MKYPKKRPHTAIGIDSHGYAVYNSPEDSAEDYIKWAEYSGMNTTFTTPEQVVGFMKKRGYFEDSQGNYLKAVKFYYELLP